MRRLPLILRPTLILSLILALMLVSGHWAVARALASGAVALELCQDGRLTAVTLDATGKPVSHDYSCPDCVLAGLALHASPAEIVMPTGRMLALAETFAVLPLQPALPPIPAARGPPVAVSA